MNNVLMQVCRETHNLTKRQVARKIGVTTPHYYDLESGRAAMTSHEGKALEKLFHIKSDHFLESSRQVELLRARKVVIKHKDDELARLKNLVTRYADLLPPGYAESGIEHF